MKLCTKCKQEKDVSEFYHNKLTKDGLTSWCKGCTCVIRYPQKNRERASNWQKNNLGKHRANDRKYKYGITPEEYNNLWKLQNNVCAICEEPETKTRNRKVMSLSVDHDHKTGRIRGLLCHKCNTKLASIENLEFRIKAIKYLEKE